MGSLPHCAPARHAHHGSLWRTLMKARRRHRSSLTDRPRQNDEEGTPPAPRGAHPKTHQSFSQRLALPLKPLRQGTLSTPRIL